jgi:general secretion pathway protein B
MSYILDALRRADSERERGAVPSLNAQPEPLLPEDEAAPPRAGRWTWAAAALGVIVVLGGALAWALTRPEAGAPTTAQAPLQRSALPPAGPPLASPAAAPSASAPTLPPLPPEAYAPPPVAARPAARPPLGVPAGEAALAPAPTTAPAMAPTAAVTGAPGGAAGRGGATGAAGARRPAASAPGDALTAEPPRIYAQHELPEEVRRAIPALVVNGSVYSKNPADRFLIINGQIVHEKGVVAPDVVLEQIRQRAAVLNSKGFRFEITY